MLNKKKILVIGIMSDRSIAYGIAHAMNVQGAELGLSYLERFEDRVASLAEPWKPWLLKACDATNEDQIRDLVEAVKEKVGKIDGLVHSIAFAPKELLEGGFLDNMTREGFLQAHDVSSYSFSAFVKAFLPIMNEQGAFCTMTYLGSQRAIPNYNIMGVAKASLEASVRYLAMDCAKYDIRVNAVSAGPVRTPSAAGVKDMRAAIGRIANASMIKKRITIEQVGNVCSFLCSPLSSGITGEVIYVDNGFRNCLGLTDY